MSDPLSNGIRYTVPQWVAYQIDEVTGLSVEIEDQGVEPDFPVDPNNSYDETHDYVLEEALALF
jgi:hypothetical protein